MTIDKFKYGMKWISIFLFLKEKKFKSEGIFDISFLQKSENKYIYIPAKSEHTKHTIKNNILGELKRYIRCNSIKNNYLKIQIIFLLA